MTQLGTLCIWGGPLDSKTSLAQIGVLFYLKLISVHQHTISNTCCLRHLSHIKTEVWMMMMMIMMMMMMMIRALKIL